MRLPRSHALPIVALALVVASCGGGDSTTDSSPESTAAATSASTASEPVTSDTTGGDAAGSTMSATDAAAVDEAASEFLASPYVNGATALYVAVSDPQKGDYVQAYGDASVDGPAATVDDSFRIGSITKTFTAVVVLKMVEDGQISLDDTVEDLLADLAVDHPELAPLTVRQLLSMTSGVTDYLNAPDSVVTEIVADPTRVWGAEELVAAGVEAGVGEPGTPGYSTTNYIVLQLIVESLAGSTIQDLIAQQISEPLGLEHTVLPPNDDTTLPDPATSGYVAGGCVTEIEADGATVDDGTDVTDWNASYGQGGGGMTSTIADLVAWAQTLTGNSLLGDELAAQRLEVASIGSIDYGLGIMQVGSWLGHEGEAIGWEAIAVQDPTTGVSVALAANGCGGLIAGFAELLDTLYPEGGAYDALAGA